MDNSEPKEKQKSKKARSPKRTSGGTVEQIFVSRSNPLADLLFGSITKEMVEAASRGELLLELPKEGDREKDQLDHQRSTSKIERSKRVSKRSTKIAKFSTTPAESAAPTPAESAGVSRVSPAESAGVSKVSPAESAGVNSINSKGFLAIPHRLLEKMFSEIKLYSAFKVYLYLYQKAFRKIHDNRTKAICNLALSDIIKECSMADRVVRDALKALSESGWINIENRSGLHNNYVINRPSPAESAGHLKKDHDHDLKKEDHLKKEFSDDDFLSVIKQVYEELTKNSWTSKDTENYKNIPSDLQTEDVIRYMKAIHERTKKPIGSFAYFVKAIAQERKSPKTRQATISKLRKIVESVKQANVGGKPLSNTDFREQIKEEAAREGIPYTPDLMEEALKPQK
jgi:hypothetical protein